jgi:hypothetical protein
VQCRKRLDRGTAGRIATSRTDAVLSKKQASFGARGGGMKMSRKVVMVIGGNWKFK